MTSRRPGRQAGSTTIEVAVLFPAFLTLLFAGVQAAEWYHTRNLCLAAARDGVRVARTTTGDVPAGVAAARRFLARTGQDFVSDVHVDGAGSGPTVVRITVTATAPRILPLPGLVLRVTQTAQAGEERFTPDSP
ncbi:MAG TPA: TadE family protein [Mycobacteriales bacterium]|nr:TadE family protein [Mycobacteriales bacterium]